MQKSTPVKSAGGSTNYHPVFVISGWAERKDLKFVPKGVTPSQASQVLANTGVAPSTGSTRAEAPKVAEPAMADDDFG
jgi:hypothetical protein